MPVTFLQERLAALHRESMLKSAAYDTTNGIDVCLQSCSSSLPPVVRHLAGFEKKLRPISHWGYIMLSVMAHRSDPDCSIYNCACWFFTHFV